MPKLYAISDFHLGKRENREALQETPFFNEDWLIVAGDVGETCEHLEFAWNILTKRFAQIIWTPGNHELWSMPDEPAQLRGQSKYDALVAVCRRHKVLTPEDPYPLWTGDGPRCILAPLFLLYDYSFRPDDVPADRAIAWALESDVLCTDERLLFPDPYPTRQAWCEALCTRAEERLAAAAAQAPLVLINHFPLRKDLAVLPRIPRFSIWCGTRRTEDWHLRFGAIAVIYGHLHLRATKWRDNVRFEEVSLGYPKQWRRKTGVAGYLRKVFP